MDTKLFTKHRNLGNRAQNSTSSKSVNRLARCLGRNKSTSDSAIPTNRRGHRRSERPFFLSRVCLEFVPPIMPG